MRDAKTYSELWLESRCSETARMMRAETVDLDGDIDHTLDGDDDVGPWMTFEVIRTDPATRVNQFCWTPQGWVYKLDDQDPADNGHPMRAAVRALPETVALEARDLIERHMITPPSYTAIMGRLEEYPALHPLRMALNAVLLLHKPEFAGVRWECPFCMDGHETPYEYPCPTVGAMADELAPAPDDRG